MFDFKFDFKELDSFLGFDNYAPLVEGLTLLSLVVLAWLVMRPARLMEHALRPAHLRSVAIVVLGDIGRSPRMMYHAESFANSGFETFLIGYDGSPPIASLLSLPHVRFMYLTEPWGFISKLPRSLFIVFAPIKVIQQVLGILHTILFEMPYTPEFILVQNPPTIPTLALVQLAAWMHGSKLIIDWHNLGYTILAMRLGKHSIFVKFAKLFEKTFGQKAFAHLFVTRAMRDYVDSQWKLRGQKVVLHDRPPTRFHATEPTDLHDLFNRLASSFTGDDFFPPFVRPKSTPLTKMQRYESLTASSFGPTSLPGLRDDRPAVVVSSTSWTPDEDFSILLEAMILYEERARAVNVEGQYASQRLPKLLVIITGKGSLKEKYMREIGEMEREKGWLWVRCRPLWLDAEDYPVLLGSADLGVSLHTSSSGLDLPMKIVDMFGCGLPVCALNFPCLDELVHDGQNGLVFSTSQQLAEQFERLLKSFPKSPQLAKLRSTLKRGDGNPQGWSTWQENWDIVVKPVITHRMDPDLLIT